MRTLHVEAQQVKDTRGTFKRIVSRSSIEEIRGKTHWLIAFPGESYNIGDTTIDG